MPQDSRENRQTYRTDSEPARNTARRTAAQDGDAARRAEEIRRAIEKRNAAAQDTAAPRRGRAAGAGSPVQGLDRQDYTWQGDWARPNPSTAAQSDRAQRRAAPASAAGACFSGPWRAFWCWRASSPC